MSKLKSQSKMSKREVVGLGADPDEDSFGRERRQLPRERSWEFAAFAKSTDL